MNFSMNMFIKLNLNILILFSNRSPLFSQLFAFLSVSYLFVTKTSYQTEKRKYIPCQKRSWTGCTGSHMKRMDGEVGVLVLFVGLWGWTGIFSEHLYCQCYFVFLSLAFLLRLNCQNKRETNKLLLSIICLIFVNSRSIFFSKGMYNCSQLLWRLFLAT